MHKVASVLVALGLSFTSGSALAQEISPRVSASENMIRLDLSVPRPALEKGPDGFDAVIRGFRTEAPLPGQPRLPVAYYNVILPPGTQVAGIDIQGEPGEFPGSYRIAWGQTPQPIGTPALPRTAPDRRVYDSDEAFPPQPARLSGTGRLHGHTIATLAVHPVQVRPRSGRVLHWSNLQITLRLAPAAAAGPAPRGLARDLDELARVTVNPEAAATGSAADSPRTGDVPYLIITTPALGESFERLRRHRVAHGMNAEILTIDEILASFPGRDDAEKVRNAVARYYHDHGTSFVLLGGDDADDAGNQIVPVRFCSPYDNEVSDYYFGALDGDWDTDADGTFCEEAEVDYFTEVHIGRATVDTPAEAGRFIDKVIAYESGLSEQRRLDLVMMGEKLDDSTWGEDAKNRIVAFIPPEYAIDKLYGRNETFSASNVIQSLNRGPNLVNHDGHAGWDYVMGIGIGDVEALSNTSPFFGYSIGCYSGAFDYGVSGATEAISEHFTTATHGAVAVVMNSRYGWYYVGWDQGLSAELDRECFDALFNEGLATFGEANDDARADNAGTAQGDGTMRYCFLETNLHGDPATPAALRRTQVRYNTHRIDDSASGYGNSSGFPDPGETFRLAVTLRNSGTAPATGVWARLSSSTPGVAVHDDWAAWPDLAPGQEAENLGQPFSARFSLACGAEAAFRLEVHHDGVTDVSVFTVAAGQVSEVVLKNYPFETQTAWTVGGNALEGAFVRQNPNGVADPHYGQVQPEDDYSETGSICYVTGNPEVGPDFQAAMGDVDRGNTYIQSPVFDGTGEGRLKVRFARWYFRANVGWGNSGVYTARVSTDNGGNWTDLERLESTAPSWRVREIDLSALVTPSTTMRLRFEAADSAKIFQTGEPLNELAIDDVKIFRRTAQCAAFSPGEASPPNPVGNTLAVERQGTDLVLTWTAPPVDFSHGPARFYPVFRSASPLSGFGQSAAPTLTGWRDCGAGHAVFGSWYYLVAAENAAGLSTEIP